MNKLTKHNKNTNYKDKNNPIKIALLLSGGVDSSVSLMLLKEQAKQKKFDITAFYLKIWLEDELSYLGDCPWEEDLTYAREVCNLAQVPLKIVSLQKEYHKEVVSYTLKEIRAGRTPNPDMMCNFKIKFGTFYKKYAKKFDYIATGHYARKITKRISGKKIDFLCRNSDPVKDQTYFLAYLSQEQIQKAMFPIGEYTKEQVRECARKYNLPNKERKDSQGICFLGKVKFKDFLLHHMKPKPGELIDYCTGNKLGMHDGFYFYTLGQRKGFGLGHGPWYVVKKDPKKNIVYLSNRYDELKKERTEFRISNCNWNYLPPKKKNLLVKIRHSPEFNCCELLLDKSRNSGIVKLKNIDQGIAPGQYAVFYDKSICLGSGVIN